MASSVPLSDAQQEWLAAHQQWRVGVVMAPPYAEYDQRQRRLSGFHVQFIERLADNLGVSLQWHRFVDEAALDDAMRANEIDLAPGLFRKSDFLQSRIVTRRFFFRKKTFLFVVRMS